MSETIDLLQREQEKRPQARRAFVPANGYAPVLAAMDTVFILGLSVAIGVIYHFLVYGDPGVARTYAPLGVLTAFFHVCVQSLLKQYDVSEIVADPASFRRIFYAWNIAVFCVLFIGFTAKIMEVYSRGAFILLYFSGVLGLSLIRAASVSFLRLAFQKGWLATKRLFLLGTKNRIRDFREQISSVQFGLQVADTGTLPEIRNGEGSEFYAARLEQALERAVERTRSLSIDNVVLLLPWSQSEAITACRKAFQETPAVPVLRLGPELGRAFDVGLSRIGPAVGLNLGRAPLNAVDTFLKRGMDLVIATTALLVLAPFLLIIAILIKLESEGPMLFRQYRHGFNQEPFRIYKFRSMKVMEDGNDYRQAV